MYQESSQLENSKISKQSHEKNSEKAAHVEPPSDKMTTSLNHNLETNSFSLMSKPLQKDPSYIFTQDEEFDFLMKSPKKSTSLKIKKPSEESAQKKVVRFSDALGLELTSTWHVFDSEEPPLVPDSAIKDLNIKLEVPLVKYKESKQLCLCFSSPYNFPNFYKRLNETKVLLETCLVDESNNSVYGTIRVVNLAYEKYVKVRYTFNNWLTHDEISASYSSSFGEGYTDQFQYIIYLPDSFRMCNNLQFSVQYSVNNQEYWDNNYGINYRVDCYIGNKFY